MRTPYAIATAALLERALSDDPERALSDDPADAVFPDDVGKWIHEHSAKEYESALRGVLDKGLIREERRRVLLVFRTTRYPEADGTVEAALRGRLAEVVLQGAEPDPAPPP